jgi:hypothetical protein
MAETKTGAIISFDESCAEIERAVAVLARYWAEEKLSALVECALACEETHVASLVVQAAVAYDAEREWCLSEEGVEYATITACSLEEALDEARSNVDRNNYSDAEGTIWVDVHVHCPLTDESGGATVQLDEPEPECPHADGHDWQSPHDAVGGCESNPGVWGKGGGVIITEVCLHCGCEKVTDTWAQDPTTGEQGLTSVTYEVGKYASAITLM